jgi:hypothetical protein
MIHIVIRLPSNVHPNPMLSVQYKKLLQVHMPLPKYQKAKQEKQ